MPGLRRFLAQYAKLWGDGGALARRGLIPSLPAVQARSAAIVHDETLLDPRELK